MLKAIGLHARPTRKLVVVTILLIWLVGPVAIGAILPVEAAALAQGHHATPGPGSMMHNGMMENGILGSGMSMAAMGAIMDQMMGQMHSMMGTMPMSGTMPINGTVPMSGTVPMAGMMPMCAMMHAANSMTMTGTMPLMGMMSMTGTMPMMQTMPVTDTMHMTGTMPKADMGMMMQMMGIMQMHIGCMHMMMGAMMSESTMSEGMIGRDMMSNRSAIEIPSDIPFDAAFIDGMIEHHQVALDMAEMAVEQADHEEVQILAEEIIAAQVGEVEQLLSWRSEWYPDLTPPAGMHSGTGAISDDESVPFDQRFLEAMTSHHKGAIDIAVRALEGAQHEEIRTLAEEIIVSQTAEIHHMQGQWAEWYGTAD